MNDNSFCVKIIKSDNIHPKSVKVIVHPDNAYQIKRIMEMVKIKLDMMDDINN